MEEGGLACQGAWPLPGRQPVQVDVRARDEGHQELRAGRLSPVDHLPQGRLRQLQGTGHLGQVAAPPRSGQLPEPLLDAGIVASALTCTFLGHVYYSLATDF